LRAPWIVARLEAMGAKYLPTIKDQKASQRFQQKQERLHQLKKQVAALLPKPDRKK
jgi:hypothetical protein